MMEMELNMGILLMLILFQVNSSGAQTCTLSSNKVQFMRLQIPGDALNVAVNDNGVTATPSATLDGFIQRQWRRFLNTVHSYRCSDGVPRITLRNTVQLNRRFYFFDSTAGNRLDFKLYQSGLQDSPDDEGILHIFTPGPQLDFLVFISAERRNTLRINGANIIYNPGNFQWNIFPDPKFDGQRSDGEIWGGNARFRGSSLEEQVEQRIQIIRRNGNLDTISLQDPGFSSVPQSVLQFDIRSYKLYTGFDNRGRFTYVKSIVLKDPGREYYIAPTIEQDTGIVPLCETFRFSRWRTPITFQSVTLKHFDDVAEARRSPLVSANITRPYLADERWFQVEERNEEFVRLRLSYDLDKYLAMMRVGENEFKFVVTHFRYDVSSVLSFDFDIQFPETVPAERPQTPCMVANTCSWPGEVKLRNRFPNVIPFPSRHPSCGASSSGNNRHHSARPWSRRQHRQRSRGRRYYG